MKSPLLYILEVLFCSGLLLAFYRLLLVRKVSFAACRRYLIAAVLLSAILPALDIPVYPARTVVYPLPLITEAAAPVAAERGGEAVDRPIDWRHAARLAVAGLYVMTVLVSLGLLVLHVVRIRRLRRRSRLTDCGPYTLAENPQVATPFSFLRTVFLGDGCEGRRREIVLCHEASHVRHRHSAERIAVELMRGFFWFNPFVWIAGRWLQEVHEWEADRDVLDAGYDLTEYRTVIFRQLFGYNPDIACGLNRSFTKNRFAMMTQFKERRFALLRLGAAIPVVAGMMMLCSFTVRTPESAAAGKSGPPAVTVHIAAGGKILLDGQPVTIAELERLVAAEREKLAEADRAQMVVVLQAEKSTPVDSIARAMTALRRANALRLECRTGPSGPGVLRMLPPDPSRLPADGSVKLLVPDKQGNMGTLKIQDRNLFGVRIEADDKVAVCRGGGEEPVSVRKLPALIKAFILNASDDPGLSAKRMQEFALPGGGTMSYPVSEGIVSLQVAREASFGRYVEVQRLVAQAFGEVRDELSRRQFGRDCASLTEAERQVVVRAVPLKITESPAE